VEWWQDQRFTEIDILEAAELVAFDVLNPVLRSRGTVSEKARKLYDDPHVQGEFRSLFAGPPSGTLRIDSLPDLATRLSDLEARVKDIERRLTER
jgi:hypothetical protein